jgi:hypothetical protein
MLGATLAMACLVGGIGFASHEFHRALVMQGEPVLMDWETLVRDGYGEHPHIRLVHVAIVDPENERDDRFGDVDLDELMDDPALRLQLQNSAVGMAKVIPIGADEDDVPRRVLIAGGARWLEEGFRQVEQTGSVTGMVSTYGIEAMIADVIGYCTGEQIESEANEDEPIYTIVPMDGNPDLSKARTLFLTVGFGLSLGLILCGSGGPGFLTVWFAPLPALLSLAGYPMRYGRGGLTTRLAYVALGGTLMGYGYVMLIPLGNFGSADGNPIFHAVGFASLFIGLAAVLAVPMQITMRSLHESVEVQPRRRPLRMSWNQACSLEPTITEIDYADQTLARQGALPLIGELKEKADAFHSTGFTRPESLQWQRDSGVSAAAVQLGCHNMVVTDLEYNNDHDTIEAGLISVLGTGLPIITVSENSSVTHNRPSAKCLFQQARSSDPVEMLADHLAAVVEEAEKRDTFVVKFNESETQQAVHFARRVLAEVQGTRDGKILNVGPKRYGRFHFPPAPVAELVR